jgi:hypothetical protein
VARVRRTGLSASAVGFAVALVLAVLTGVVYGLVGITAEEYFSTEYAQLHEGMPEQLRGEEGQR